MKPYVDAGAASQQWQHRNVLQIDGSAAHQQIKCCAAPLPSLSLAPLTKSYFDYGGSANLVLSDAE
jgi:hypothetical protein